MDILNLNSQLLHYHVYESSNALHKCLLNLTFSFYERKCPLRGFRNYMHRGGIMVCTKPKFMHRNLELHVTIAMNQEWQEQMNNHFNNGLCQDCRQ